MNWNFVYLTAGTFLADLIQKEEHRLTKSFNLSFRYMDDVYPKELEIKDSTDNVKSASYRALHLEIDGKENY